ncbi:Na+/H+ antiporter subunit E [Sulfurimonas sp. SWIR-19]|uniref:Na+/H+ antiporter subunit E n=1 Tax=Sulfurimonas sp. SWIR-19 TaxID=2878390 RepID=UPI001CF2D671|nr:Na+/H+ antiporter subunit E [Sulfurimonas sp. SWIR-19]UCN00879.1 Na+/H+ antiporter subunit E [Sulfurimonas sp. SWIR-19]
MKYILLKRVFLFLVIWLILTEGNPASFWIGIPAVLLSACISLVLLPPVFWNFTALLRFIPFYLIRSLLGGVDVMLRVFHPDLPINPGLVEYKLHIRKPIEQDMIVNVLNLLPGTLSVNIKNDLLLIHVLDIGKNIKKELALIEEYIHNIFSKKTATQGSVHETI